MNNSSVSGRLWTPSVGSAGLDRRRLLLGGAAAAGLAAMGAILVRPGAARADAGTVSGNFTLTADQSVVSPGGAYRLIMQGDGNVVLTPTSHYEALWSTGTANVGADRAVMQGDGNFVVYAGNSSVFATGTANLDGAVLKVQDDANVVIYVGGQAVWNRYVGFMNTIQPLGMSKLPRLEITGKVSADQATSGGDDDESTEGWIPPSAHRGDVVKATAYEPDGKTRTSFWTVDYDWAAALKTVGQAASGGFLFGFLGASITMVKNPTSPAEVLWNISTLGFRTVVGLDFGLLAAAQSAAGQAAFPPLALRPFEAGDIGRIVPTSGFFVRDGKGGGAVFSVSAP